MPHVPHQRISLTRQEIRNQLSDMLEIIHNIVDQRLLEEMTGDEQWNVYNSVKKLYFRFDFEYFPEEHEMQPGDILPDGSIYQG